MPSPEIDGYLCANSGNKSYRLQPSTTPRSQRTPDWTSQVSSPKIERASGLFSKGGMVNRKAEHDNALRNGKVSSEEQSHVYLSNALQFHPGQHKVGNKLRQKKNPTNRTQSLSNPSPTESISGINCPLSFF
jgi:hypothetical protein